ncbi:unnamed protein product [Merluccius merluccius]
MKLTSVALLCLTSLLVLTHFTLARKGSSSGGGKSTPSRSNSGSSSSSSSGSSGGSSSSGTSNRGNTNTAKKTPKGPQTPPGSYPKQAPPNQWRPASNQWGYPQPGRGAASYPNQYPAGGYGYGGAHPVGGHMNYNPNNKILSPGYAGSYGYGGTGGAGGSPFARSVAGMGMNPSAGSKGFGRTAVVAAGVGVVSGMALGYGLGRFPRPPFRFHNAQEEHHYNHYMYKKYGTRSTDQEDYSRDYKYTPVPIPFDKHMDTCMKRQDLFPSESKQGTKGPAKAISPTAAATAAAPPAAAAATTTAASPIVDIVTANSTSSNASGGSSSNDTAVDTNLTAPCPNQTNQPCADPPLPPAVEDVSKAANRDDIDDDTVSIVEIGYPALIDQLKAMRCVELYMVYSDRFLQKLQEPAGPRGGAQGTGKGLQQVSTVVTGTLLMLMSSVVLMLP